MLREKCKGITLVALVITIVILIILAGISISTLTNTGIFQKAKDAKGASENAEKEQRQTLSEYERELNKYTAQELTDDKINKVLSETENIVLKDANGNIFTLPAGFKVVVNDDTGNAKTVDKGIVIEDVTDAATKGSQFVWVPVGTITKTDGTQVEIELNRYTFDEDGNAVTYEENAINENFAIFQEIDLQHTNYIENFKESVTKNGGYYIGRFEARTNKKRTTKYDELTLISEKKEEYVYNYIAQHEAKELSQRMYINSVITSDLTNAYAWDTAIIFIQKCTNQNNYSNKKSSNFELAEKGTVEDVQVNIFDMSSNIYEWTTEVEIETNKVCFRGGFFGDRKNWTSIRFAYNNQKRDVDIGFRPMLYIKN